MSLINVSVILLTLPHILLEITLGCCSFYILRLCFVEGIYISRSDFFLVNYQGQPVRLLENNALGHFIPLLCSKQLACNVSRYEFKILQIDTTGTVTVTVFPFEQKK